MALFRANGTRTILGEGLVDLKERRRVNWAVFSDVLVIKIIFAGWHSRVHQFSKGSTSGIYHNLFNFFVHNCSLKCV